jgi:tubulin monoglycylase TTLL3/8
LIIKQKKFDIRQWVVVTSWHPIVEIWLYSENYLRFTSDNYDPNQLHNKFANLTNASINKENKKVLDIFHNQDLGVKGEFSELDGEQFKIHGNMWAGN